MTDSARAPRSTMEVHFKLFGTDGVSLQSQELTKALRQRGWTVRSCASDVPEGLAGLRLPALSYQSSDAVALRERIFAPGSAPPETGRSTGAELTQEVIERSRPIREEIERYVDRERIALLHIRNVMSLPYNLPASVALHGLAVDRTDLRFLMQHHDLFWEGPNARTFRTPYPEIAELIERVMVPRLPNAHHVLINPIAADALRAREGIDGTVVPDGFDFDRDVARIDGGALRSRLTVLAGDDRPIGPDDLVVDMPARVALNKAIELAIQFVAGLDHHRSLLEGAPDGVGVAGRRFTTESRVVLLLPQGEDLEDNREYFDRLVAYARESKITLAYGGDIVVPDQRLHPGDTTHYPFYSTYQAVDMVCYPPEHEGFGNQAIEAVWAKKPLAVLEYPVFKRFVRDHVPHYISLGDTEHLQRLDGFGGLHQLAPDVLENAVTHAITLLTDHDRERHWSDENYVELRSFCGMDTVTAEYIRLYGALGVGGSS